MTFDIENCHCISGNSFHGNYSRVETIRGNTVFTKYHKFWPYNLTNFEPPKKKLHNRTDSTTDTLHLHQQYLPFLSRLNDQHGHSG